MTGPTHVASKATAGANRLVLDNEPVKREARRSIEIKRGLPTTASSHHGRGSGSQQNEQIRCPSPELAPRTFAIDRARSQRRRTPRALQK